MNVIDSRPAIIDRQAWRGQPLCPEEAALVGRDQRVSFTQANGSPALMSVAGAAGIWLTDVSGQRYMDFYGNNCHHIGYQHPEVVSRIRVQLDKYCFVPRGLTSQASIELAELLIANYPVTDSKVLFVPGGAAAVELSLMIAKVHTGRQKTISFWDSYHGRSAGALSVGGSSRDRSPRIGSLMPGSLHAMPFYWHARKARATPEDIAASAQASLESLNIIFECEKDVAAVIAEPIRNGAYVPPQDYWAQVRALCDRHNALLIFDEIPAGLGKTGKLFNSEHFGISPDMTVLGKALGGAIAPLAAVIANSSLDTAPELNLGYFTHEKNALSAAAGLATLSVIVNDQLPQRAKTMGTLVESWLTKLCSDYRLVANVRSSGLMFAMDFDDVPVGKTGADLATEAYFSMLRSGLLVNSPKGNSLSFSPPLVISEDELRRAFNIVEATIQSLS